MSLIDLIDGLADWGECTALRFRTEYRGFSWTYRSLHRAILQMSSLLGECGVGPGDRVMIWAPNSPQWVIAFLGCLYHGGVAVPLDLRSQPAFLSQVASTIRPKLLLRTRLKPDPKLATPTIISEELVGQLDRYNGISPSARMPGLDDVAELVYTSGTVASPKGVILTHGNLTAEVHSIAPVVPPEPAYRFLTVLPLSHIFAQMIGLLLPLSRGATIVLLETVKPTAILTALQRERITVFPAVPRLLESMRRVVQGQGSGGRLGTALFNLALVVAPHLSFGWRRALWWPVHHRLGGALDYLVSGGASLDPALERFWDALGFLLLQGYGLTETASAVSCNRIDARRIGSVGKVLPGQEVRIGRRDEILVRGANVTPGYCGDSAATADAFDDGWFKTGDAGRRDRDDFLYIKGRLKEVIVTSAGVNVYPEDVETVLAHQPSVRDCAVVEWQGVVHAVLLLSADANPREIVAKANKELDSAQQIQSLTIWPLPDFPRTATSKVRKRDVLDFLAGRERLAVGGEILSNSSTSVQAILARLTSAPAAALKPEATLGFDLRLSSIDRLELVSRLEQELGVDLADDQVTAQTTVSQLECLIGGRRLPPGLPFPRWALWPFTRLLRGVLQRWVAFPVLRTALRMHVAGKEQLAGLVGPCLFAANHQSYIDPAVIEMALPEPWRSRVAVAAWAEYFEAPGRSLPIRVLRRLAYYGAVLLVNAFPLSQTRIARPSVQYMGELVEAGESILIFPEGRRTPSGEIEPFKVGIGLLASALRVPVVPVRVQGLFDLIYHGPLPIPRRGQVTVKFGRPLRFDGESYGEIADAVAAAVKAL